MTRPTFATQILILVALLASGCEVGGDANNTEALLSASDASLLYVQKSGDTMTGSLVLPSNGLTIGTNQFFMSNGDIGIGTTTPTRALHLYGSGDVIGKVDQNLSSIGYAEDQFLSDTGDFRVGMSSSGSNGAFHYTSETGYIGTISDHPVIVGTDNRARLIVDTSGNVGIGTTSPAQRLQVGTSGDGSEAIANTWATFSDLRLKRDIEKIPNSCDLIDQLNGYYYYWKKGSDRSRQVGVIAQEVEAVLPELVRAGSDGIKTVDYSKLTAVLIEASKEHNREIAELRSENTQLKQENEAIKAYLCEKDPSAAFCE